MLYSEAPNFRTLEELLHQAARFVPVTIARRIDTTGLDVVATSDDGHVAFRTELPATSPPDSEDVGSQGGGVDVGD